MRQEPDDPAICTEATRHPFWLEGYADNKFKDDRMIANGDYKVINYSEFGEVIAKAVLEISTKSLGPIEVGKLTRRHWNALNEPIVSDLKKRVSRKNKKARGKSAGPPAKIPKPNPPAPAATPEVAQSPQVEAAGVEAVTAGTSTAQTSAVPGGATGGPTLPTPNTQPLLPTPTPCTQGYQNPGVGAFGCSENPPPET